MALALEDGVEGILVLVGGPEPEDAEGGPEVLVDAEELAVDETRLELVELARGAEEVEGWWM